MLLFNLDRQAHQTRGDIACGGIATVLATTPGLNIANLQPLDGERRITLRILRAVGMVLKKQGIYVIHIPRAGRLFPAPLPNNLFSIEDGRLHYVEQEEQVEIDPELEEPEEGEVVEEAWEPEQEVPAPNPYTTYNDVYSLRGSIDNMSNLANSLRDAMHNLSEHFTNWSQVWDPENYLPPQ